MLASFGRKRRRCSALPKRSIIHAAMDAREAQRRRLTQGIDGKDAFLVPARRLRPELALREVARRLLDGPLLLSELEIHACSAADAPAMIAASPRPFNAT